MMSKHKNKSCIVTFLLALMTFGVNASPHYFAERVFTKLKFNINSTVKSQGFNELFLAPPPPPSGTVSVQVNAGSDDAEQNLITNVVVTNSTDLELTYDLVGQAVGMRFNTITVPKGAIITGAYLEFVNKTALSTALTLTISGQAIDNAPTFTTASNNIASRTKTTATTSWTPGNWATLNAAYQSVDISNIVQEIVNRSGWASGNSMVMMLNTSSLNYRRSYSYDGGATLAPKLVINYTLVEVCGNGIDDDGDGLIDDADLDCGTFCPTGNLSLERWLNIGSGSAVTDLTSHANYPNNPSESTTLSNFDGPDNYADNYGTRVRGYLTPAVTGTYSFNLTSDDGSELYLSTDADPANKALIATVAGYTGTAEYTKYPSQTSTNLTLIAGQNYYVELLQKEGGGGDHFQVYWKTPASSTWTIVPGTNLRPFGCVEICGNGLDDDGDGLVDAADADCGTFCPTGKLNLERWLSISGTIVSDLTGNASYPNNPSEATTLISFDGPDNYADNFGQRARGYLTPTQTGIYTFNLTSDDASELYLSTDANPANKKLIAAVAGWTNTTEFTKYSSQTSYSLILNAGRNYYVEVLNKEGSGGDHFQVYWKTPSNNSWTIIPGVNLRPYACSETCGNGIDDDGDGFTDCDCDLITNGEFDNGLTGWGMTIQPGSSATGALDNTSQLSGINSGAVTITTASGTDWHIQAYQAGLSIQSGKTYTVSFQSKSTGSRTMGVVLQQAVSPYTVYWAQTVTLSATGSTFTFDYPSTVTNTGQVALIFNMGSSNKKVWIDKISVTPKCAVEICGNGLDDDGNGLTDCADGACPSPSTSISGTNSICIGASTSLTATGGATYVWSTGATTAAVTVAPAATTTYTVTVTNASGCTATATATVTVNAAPNVTISGTGTTCTGASRTLTATGGNTYVWSTGATTAALTVTPATTSTYTVTATNASGCTATATATVTVNASPIAAVSGTNYVCSGSSTTLLTATGGGTYLWSSGATTASVTVSPVSTTTYTVTVTNASGCTATANRIVTVNTCTEICNNSLDDDGDGLIDCADSDCSDSNSSFGTCISMLNTGFENGLTNWTVVGTVANSTDVHTGTKSVLITGIGAGIDQNITVTPGQAYKLETWSKKDGTNWTGFGIDWQNSSGTTLGYVNSEVLQSATFRNYAINAIAPPGTTKANIWAYSDGGMNAWYDDFCFSTNGTTTLSKGNGPNVMINGGFESHVDTLTFPTMLSGNPSRKIKPTEDNFINGWQAGVPTGKIVYYIDDSNHLVNNPEGDFFIWMPDKDLCFISLSSLVSTPMVNGKTYTISFNAAPWEFNLDANFNPTGTAATQGVGTLGLEFIYGNVINPAYTVSEWKLPASSSWSNLNWHLLTYTFTYDASNPLVKIYLSNYTTMGMAVDGIQLREDIPCFLPEICNNSLDDDGDGLIDCADSDCKRITLATPVVSACINQPLQDVATVSVQVSWVNAPANDQIEVSIYGQTERINTASLTSPQTVTFTVPANGATNKTITASWRTNTSLCSTTTTFNAPAACSNDQVGCNILYLCGLDKPNDGDPWDHGFMAYLDEINGSNIVMPVLTKADASGMGTYNVNSPNTPISITLSNYSLVVVSATTEGSIAPALVAALKSFPGAVMNSNYDIIDDLGMSSVGGGYQFQNNLFVDNSLSKEIYNFNNDINPSYSKVFTRGNYTAAADAYLWTNAGEQALGVNGVYFGYSSADAMPGVAAGHGRRVYLGYHMNGVYANLQNGGALPAPVASYFVPATHLTLDGKNYFDLAILDATKACNTEICNNGIDDNDNGLVDCAETVCGLPVVSSVSKTNASNCPSLNNGQITVTAGGSNLEYSVNGGTSYQSSNAFTGLAVGSYNIRVRNSVTGCFANYASNPVQITGTTCPEICNNGIDDDGDGLTDCLDTDCKPTVNAGSDVNICLGANYTISASASGGTAPYTYSWSNGLGSGQSKTVTPLATTTYTVTVSSVGGCTATDAILVNVAPCPEICTDGIDNDGDGLVDCADPDCMATAAPHLVGDVYQTCPGIVFQEQPIFNDNNLQNAAYSIYSNPSRGTVSINNQGVFTYTPTQNTCGVDSFMYQVCNAVTGCCDHATVVLNLGDNLPPVLQNVPADLTIGCGETVPAPPIVFGVDACPGIYVSFEETSDQVNAGSCQNYTITRSWSATDKCGNTGTASQKITVMDGEVPEIFRVYTLENGKKALAGINNNAGTSWKHVKFPISFNSPPLVFSQVITYNAPEAVGTRIRNVDAEGFDLKLQEEENGDGIHAAEKVAWVAIEPGNLTDGSLQAGSVSNVTQALKVLNYSKAFASVPQVIAAPQTSAEADPVQIRFSNASTTSTQLFLQEEQSKDVEVAHANETVAYLAAENGTIEDEYGDFIAVASPALLNNTWQTINLGKKYSKPVVVFGGQPTGNDPATVRVRNVTATSFEARIQEWQYLDGTMPLRSVSYFVLEGSIPAFVQNPCSEVQTPLLPGVNLFAVDNCDSQVSMEYTETSTLTPNGQIKTLTWISSDDCGNAATIIRNDTCKLAAVRLKANLLGPMIGNGSNATLMRDDLHHKGLIPLQNPYELEPNGTLGQSNHTLLASLLEVTGDNAIVDWVLVEMRDAADSKLTLKEVPCLLQRDGDVVTELGSNIISFSEMPEGNYHVFLKHRNHLGMITGAPVFLTLNNPPLVDFSLANGPAHNPAIAGKLVNGRLTMWAGDFNNDNKIIYQGPANDIFTLFSEIMVSPDNTQNLANFILAGYKNTDINMDGNSIYQGPSNDRSMLLLNTILAHPSNSYLLANFIATISLP